MVTWVVRQQNAVESRKGETALYVSIAIPTFLDCSRLGEGGVRGCVRVYAFANFTCARTLV